MTTIQTTIWHCEHCGHYWPGRLLPLPGQTAAPRPKQCPRCTSRTWDKPRTPVGPAQGKAGEKGK